MVVNLRRRTLQRVLNFLADDIDAGEQCFIYKGRSNDPLHRKTGCTIHAAHFSCLFFIGPEVCQRNFNPLGRFGTDLEIIFAAVQIADCFVELFSAHWDNSGKNNPCVCNNGNLRTLGANIDNHGSLGPVDRNAERQRVCNRFVNKIHTAVFQSSLMCNGIIRTPFNLCHIAWD